MQTQVTNTVNGVNVEALAETLKVLTEKPSLARFTFRADNRWEGGAFNRSRVVGSHGLERELTHQQPFTLEADEPQVLLGTDRGAGPVEHLLHALASCITTSIAYHAAARGHRPSGLSGSFRKRSEGLPGDTSRASGEVQRVHRRTGATLCLLARVRDHFSLGSRRCADREGVEGCRQEARVGLETSADTVPSRIGRMPWRERHSGSGYDLIVTKEMAMDRFLIEVPRPPRKGACLRLFRRIRQSTIRRSCVGRKVGAMIFSSQRRGSTFEPIAFRDPVAQRVRLRYRPPSGRRRDRL
jgi:hypothetical protein